MADGVGGMAVDGGSRPLTLSSLAVLAFHGGGPGAGVHGAGAGVHHRAGDGRVTLMDLTATVPNTATMAMEILATAMEMDTDPTTTVLSTVTTAVMVMEILVMETVTDLVPAMQANTAPPLDRG